MSSFFCNFACTLTMNDMAACNRTSEYEMTIIVPFFNEADNMPVLEERMALYLERCSKKACLLMVDDGSTDAGASMAQEMCSRHKNFFLIVLSRNTGLSGALKAGIDACLSPIAAYIDADLQTDPEDFELLIPYLGENELVTGFRASRNDSFKRRAASSFANRWRNIFTKDGMRDTCCPLKVMKTEVVKSIPFFSGMHRFLPALVKIEGGRCREVAVNHHKRIAGKSKYGILNRLAGPFADCFVLLWMRKRRINYTISESNL